MARGAEPTNYNLCQNGIDVKPHLVDMLLNDGNVLVNPGDMLVNADNMLFNPSNMLVNPVRWIANALLVREVNGFFELDERRMRILIALKMGIGSHAFHRERIIAVRLEGRKALLSRREAASLPAGLRV